MSQPQRKRETSSNLLLKITFTLPVKVETIILYLIVCFSCTRGENGNYLSDADSLQLAEKGSVEKFKLWATDTLSKFLTNQSDMTIVEKKSPTAIVRMGVLSDTSALFIEEQYSLTIDPIDYHAYQGTIVESVISLLQEFHEIPDTVFGLSFIASTFYSPTFVEQLAYDFVAEIKDLEIEIPDRGIIIYYTYNRGDLRSKKEIVKTKPCKGCLSSRIEKNYNFIYNENSRLMEKKLIHYKRIDEKVMK